MTFKQILHLLFCILILASCTEINPLRESHSDDTTADKTEEHTSSIRSRGVTPTTVPGRWASTEELVTPAKLKGRIRFEDNNLATRLKSYNPDDIKMWIEIVMEDDGNDKRPADQNTNKHSSYWTGYSKKGSWPGIWYERQFITFYYDHSDLMGVKVQAGGDYRAWDHSDKRSYREYTLQTNKYCTKRKVRNNVRVVGAYYEDHYRDEYGWTGRRTHNLSLNNAQKSGFTKYGALDILTFDTTAFTENMHGNPRLPEWMKVNFYHNIMKTDSRIVSAKLHVEINSLIPNQRYRIINVDNNRPLADSDKNSGMLESYHYKAPGYAEGSHWTFIMCSPGIYKIQNKVSNNYIHIENSRKKGMLTECSPIQSGWWSAMWYIEPAGIPDTYYFKNRWTEEYLSWNNNQSPKVPLGSSANKVKWRVSKAAPRG